MHKRIFETERTCGGTFLERTHGILEESKGLQKEIGLPLQSSRQYFFQTQHRLAFVFDRAFFSLDFSSLV